MAAPTTPLISIVILNYNGAKWLARCLDSIQRQTIFGQIELIIADNLSTDGSDKSAEMAMAQWAGGKFVQNGANLGFCEGNNRGAKHASGTWLFFLNNDTWLEPDCLETLIKETTRLDALASTPLMLNYDDNTVQSAGGAGFDIFGLLSRETRTDSTRDIFTVGGCSYLIRSDVFWELGGFDAALFMYADEYDLTWRLWMTGRRALLVPSSRLHHRGAPNANPKGGSREIEFRTNAMKRYYSNRNTLVVLLKNAEHLLLVFALSQCLWLLLEGLLLALSTRRPSVLFHCHIKAMIDAFKMRSHILCERRRLSKLRRWGDIKLLRFLRFRWNRWDELLRVFKLGMPRVD